MAIDKKGTSSPNAGDGELGFMVDPRNLLRTVEIASRKAGVGKVGAHTMRHSAAVAWLENGVHIKAAADPLGHSSIAITGDIYGHLSDDTARAAVDGLGKALALQPGESTNVSSVPISYRINV